MDKWAILKQNGSASRTSNTKSIGNSKDVLLYPNPNDGNYTIKLKDQHKDNTITVYDNMGRVVFVVNDAKTVNLINMSGYATGIYFVNIETSEATYLKKIIIK